jgi:hypothetical protein
MLARERGDPMPGNAVVEAMRRIAKELGDVVESVSCEGTPIEAITFSRGTKAFLFLSQKGGLHIARLKLGASHPEAKRLAATDPTHFEIGANGWTKLTFGDESPPLKLLTKWIPESHTTMAPATVVKKALAPLRRVVAKKPARRPKRAVRGAKS